MYRQILHAHAIESDRVDRLSDIIAPLYNITNIQIIVADRGASIHLEILNRLASLP